jgi:tryptophanyl-tRNA synthetase
MSDDLGLSSLEAPELQQVVTPWQVEGKINYNKLIDQFGSQQITPELISRLEAVTGKPAHPWLRRKIFFSHRDLHRVLDVVESGKKFYIYTGRGPSSESLHLGHMVPFMFTKYLQEVFGAPLVVQMSDDEKYYFKPNLGLDEARRLTDENAKDIIAVGFDPKKTFIFSNMDYIGKTYRTVMKIDKFFRGKDIKAIYGLDSKSNIGMLGWPSKQIAPAFSESFGWMLDKNMPCLVPMAIDQDPYFRQSRDFAEHEKLVKPAVIHSVFFPGLTGAGGKMSSTGEEASIFLTDTPDQISEKIRKYAFSGGRDTLKEHREKGANLDVDVSYQYLQFFEMDDDKLEKIKIAYGTGQMTTGEIKKILIEVLVRFTNDHQTRRASVTEENLNTFFEEKKLI